MAMAYVGARLSVFRGKKVHTVTSDEPAREAVLLPTGPCFFF